MSLINFSNTLSLKSGGFFNKEICDIFISFQHKISLPKNFLIICDKGTEYIAQNFTQNYYVISTILDLQRQVENFDGIFAIGSGTVNDFAKFASFKAGKPFITYATALSMNGYLSSTASLLDEKGEKVSISCHFPQALYFDLEILHNAPIELTKAGFGDAMARASAQSDCLLSHKYKDTNYNEDLFKLRLPSEEFLLQNHLKLTQQDDEFILELLENTLFTGFAMHVFGSSFVASGGEHAMAHFASQNFTCVQKFLHGLQVAAFTCEMLKIQKAFKEERSFNYRSFDIEKIFHDLKIPNKFEDLGLTKEEFALTLKGAKVLRDRYGFLNLI